jgi:hypothetical protein
VTGPVLLLPVLAAAVLLSLIAFETASNIRTRRNPPGGDDKLVLGSPVEFVRESWTNFHGDARILELTLRLRGPMTFGQVWESDEMLVPPIEVIREVDARQSRLTQLTSPIGEGDVITVTLVTAFKHNPNPLDNTLPGYELSLWGSGYVHKVVAERGSASTRKVRVIADWSSP